MSEIIYNLEARFEKLATSKMFCDVLKRVSFVFSKKYEPHPCIKNYPNPQLFVKAAVTR